MTSDARLVMGIGLGDVARPAPSYTTEDHEVWKELVSRRLEALRRQGCARFLECVERIGLPRERVPDLGVLNEVLHRHTAWGLLPSTGFLTPDIFFEMLAQRRFPVSLQIRARSQLDYLPGDPDIFHDVFGHAPLQLDNEYAALLNHFGRAGRRLAGTAALARLTTLFWFTVEFGLLRERNSIRVYGSGLLSSGGEAAHALGNTCERHPFALDAVLAQPMPASAADIKDYQPVLFVIDHFGEVRDAIDDLVARLT